MRTYHTPNISYARKLPRGFLNSTFTLPSNYSGNYEGDVTMFRTKSPKIRRYSSLHHNRSDSEEEYNDFQTYFDESTNTLETLRNRLFLYELSPSLSNAILRNSFYQRLIQINTILIFLTALIILSSLDLAKRVMDFFVRKRYYIYWWMSYILNNLVPIASSLGVSLVLGYCYYIFFRSSCEIVNLLG